MTKTSDINGGGGEKEMSFQKRPTIPKLRKNRQVKESINLGNQAVRKIRDEMERAMKLTEINHLIYAASATIAETIGEKVKTQCKRKRKMPV